MKCCICGKETENKYGNNPYGAMWIEDGKPVYLTFKETDRCCNECNARYVIPGRLYRMRVAKEDKNEM